MYWFIIVFLGSSVFGSNMFRLKHTSSIGNAHCCVLLVFAAVLWRHECQSLPVAVAGKPILM